MFDWIDILVGVVAGVFGFIGIMTVAVAFQMPDAPTGILLFFLGELCLVPITILLIHALD